MHCNIAASIRNLTVLYNNNKLTREKTAMKQFKILAVAIFCLILVVVAVAVLPGLIDVNQTQQTTEGQTPTQSENQTQTQSQPPGDSNATSTTSTSSVRLESGTVVVYFMSYTSSGTSYHTVEGQTLVIESAGGGIFSYLPA
jgi:predicted metalloprotease